MRFPCPFLTVHLQIRTLRRRRKQESTCILPTLMLQTVQENFYVAQASDEDLGRTLMDRLAEQIGEKGKIGIVSGESTATNLNSWISWIENSRKEKVSGILKLWIIRYTQGGSSEQALKQAQELMTRYSDLKGLVAVASSTIPGVAQAVEQEEKRGR